MSRKNISYVKGYEHSDFTDLLNELQGKNENTEMIDGALLLDAPSSMEPVCAYEESEERHRIMSDQRIKYLYSKKDGIIHDKHCDNAKDILDEDLLWAEEYLPKLKPCPDCMIHAYIIAGAKDTKDFQASTQKETGSQEKGCRYFCCTDGERRGTGKAEPPAERQHQVPVRHPLCLRSAVFPAGVYPRQCRMVLYAPGHPGHFRLFHRHCPHYPAHHRLLHRKA